MHSLERIADQLAVAGVAAGTVIDLGWADADVTRFRLADRYALLVPGGAAHRPEKRWPAASYAALTRHLAGRGIQPVLIEPGRDRPRVMAALKDQGIQTSVHYPPIHLLAYYRRRFGFGEGMLPLTEAAGRRELTLPMFPGMTAAEVDAVCDALAAALTDMAA